MKNDDIPNIDDIINILPIIPERNDGINQQLPELQRIANRLGMYAAADRISGIILKKKSLNTFG